MAKPGKISEEFERYIVKDVSEKTVYTFILLFPPPMKINFVIMALTQAPPTVYYIPDFITEAEEEYLLQQVHVY